MSKHTPGPWHIIGGYNIYSELGGQSGDGVTADARDGWHIASIGEAPTFVDGESVYLGRDVQKANARVLVAAPDLLEALESTTECAEILRGLIENIEAQGNYSAESTINFLNQALGCHYLSSAAVAKARGEE